MYALVIATAAFAAKGKGNAGEPQWGVGGHVGTWAIPGQYPSVLPKVDPDGDGTNEAMQSIDKVRGDVILGVEGWFWVDDRVRLGLLPGLDLGTRYTDAHALLMGDVVFLDGDQLDGFGGLGLGVGTATFKGEQGDEKLVVPQYPLRAELGAMLVPTKYLAPQLRLVGQWNVPSSHRYATPGGDELDRKQVGTGLYLNLGVELSVLYGHFKAR